MHGIESKIEETLRAPELAVQSTRDANVWLYYRRYTATKIGDKLLCVLAEITAQDPFVITA